MLDLTRLKVFREVAIHGSFTKAAEAMGYAQPSISHQVAQLERELSAQLFERQARRVTLTPAGQVFLRHVQAVLVQLADAEREVAETAGTGGRLLRLASFPTAAATLIPSAVADFRARHPRGELRLTEADPPVSVPALLAGEHDLAMIYDYPVLGAAPDPALELEPLCLDHMVVALPPGHDAASSAQVRLAGLATAQWVAPTPLSAGTRSNLAAAAQVSRQRWSPRPTTTRRCRDWSPPASGWPCCPGSRLRSRSGRM